MSSLFQRAAGEGDLIEARDEGRLAGRDLLRERERLLDLLSSLIESSRASSSGDRDSLMLVIETNSSFGEIPGKSMDLWKSISRAPEA